MVVLGLFMNCAITQVSLWAMMPQQHIFVSVTEYIVGDTHSPQNLCILLGHPLLAPKHRVEESTFGVSVDKYVNQFMKPHRKRVHWYKL